MSDFSGLLNNEVFHRSLLACSIEIVLMTYSISCEYDPMCNRLHWFITSTCDPLKCKIGNPILVVLICMGKTIRIQRVNIFSHTKSVKI